MTSVNHEQVFLNFLKNHPVFSDLNFLDNPRDDQQVIGIIVNDSNVEGRELDSYIPYYLDDIQKLKNQESVVLDPNYDILYDSFIQLNHNLDSIDYIKSIVESKTTKEELTEVAIELIVKPLIACNIDSKNVYFVIHSHWNTEWCDKVIEVE
jgi:hypothetical protein